MEPRPTVCVTIFELSQSGFMHTRPHLGANIDVRVVLRLWTEVGDTVDSLRHGSEVKRLLDVLSNMLGFFEVCSCCLG